MTTAIQVSPRVPFRRRRIVRRVVVAVRWVLMSVAVTVICLSLVALVTRHQIVAVTSGSMRPGIQPGDALIVSQHGADGVAVGDIVVFKAPYSRTLIAHRVLEITTAGGQQVFRMKGDANTTSDANLIPEKDVVGEVTARVPSVGRQLYWFSQIGLKLALAVLFVFVFVEELLILIPYLRRRRKRRAALRAEADVQAGRRYR